jgi:hypothetical protein
MSNHCKMHYYEPLEILVDHLGEEDTKTLIRITKESH